MKLCIECSKPLHRSNIHGYCQQHRYMSPSRQAYQQSYMKDYDYFRAPGAVAAYYRMRRVEARQRLDAIKVAAGCTDCGYRMHAVALDFDHLPEYEKVGDISRLSNHGWTARVAAEVAKCEVVCANCHRVRTQHRRRLTAPDKSC